ncbi:MAG: hypothetical protein EXQ70_08015 [Solirubrobacterales bacterium]|nr:hypothetical protein [Solirubrobacterales bacterium]
MEVLLAVVLLGLVAAFVLAPLRARAEAGDAEADGREADLADLEARKEAKYREIRDAEADRQTGKLSEPEFARIDAELRAEAIEILKALDRMQPG